MKYVTISNILIKITSNLYKYNSVINKTLEIHNKRNVSTILKYNR